VKTFRQFLAEKDNRGGARTISLIKNVSAKPAHPTNLAAVMRPSNLMPTPAPITGKEKQIFAVKRPPNTTVLKK
jgi:hypothetical protein